MKKYSKMNRLKWITGMLGIIMFISSCDKIDELTQFDMEYETNYTISSSTGLNVPLELMSPDIESNSASTFENNNTKKDLVEEIRLEALSIVVLSPSNGDLSFLKSIEIYIEADGLDEKLIAWKDNIESNVGSSLSLETSGDDLKAYIKKDNFQLRLRTVTDEVISQDYELRADSRFFVDAKVLGQ